MKLVQLTVLGSALLLFASVQQLVAQGATYGCKGSGTSSDVNFDAQSQVLLTLTVHVYDGVCDLIDTPHGQISVQEPCTLYAFASALGYVPPAEFEIYYRYPDGSEISAGSETTDEPYAFVEIGPLPVICSRVFKMGIKLVGHGTVEAECSCSACET